MRHLLAAAIIMLPLGGTLGGAGVAWAGYGEGHAAYERGDYETALRELRPLAEQGVALAQHGLGVMYDKGEGVDQDYKEAVTWYRLAAAQALAGAQYNLGVMYRDGAGVPQDFEEAVKWYRLAAEQGDDLAQQNLGYMYANGKGVPQDYLQAHKWFNLAAAQGNEDATKNRNTLSESMTTGQIAKAQQLAAEWAAKHENSPGD